MSEQAYRATKLTADDVAFIRKYCRDGRNPAHYGGPYTGRALAARFGVSTATVMRARRGDTYKDLRGIRKNEQRAAAEAQATA